MLRAQVQLANDKQALLVAQNQYKQSLLVLARNLGMSPGTPLELAEPLRYQPLTQPQAETPRALRHSSRAPITFRLPASARSWSNSNAPAVPATIRSSASTETMAGLAAASEACRARALIQGQIDFTVFDRDRNGEAAGTCQPHQAHRRSNRRSEPRHRRGDPRGAAESRLRGRTGRGGPGRAGSGAA